MKSDFTKMSSIKIPAIKKKKIPKIFFIIIFKLKKKKNDFRKNRAF